jgi:hypothetical protein
MAAMTYLDTIGLDGNETGEHIRSTITETEKSKLGKLGRHIRLLVRHGEPLQRVIVASGFRLLKFFLL